MSKILTYRDRMVFHPAYYIQEILDAGGMSQEDFARRLGTTPKNLSVLLKGDQRLSVDMAVKLGRMCEMEARSWLALQRGYDELLAEMQADRETEKEKAVFRYLDYGDLRKRFSLPECSKTEEQIGAVRTVRNVSSLCVLKDADLAVRFRNEEQVLNEKETVLANILVLSAVNEVLKEESPAYDRKSFRKAVSAVRTDMNPDKVAALFQDCGVVLKIVTPLPDSKTRGAVKPVGNRVMMMLCRQEKEEDFLMTLFHEAAHILHGEYGILFEDSSGEKEMRAEQYAGKRMEILKRRSAA